jgi:hypothetical protein
MSSCSLGGRVLIRAASGRCGRSAKGSPLLFLLVEEDAAAERPSGRAVSSVVTRGGPGPPVAAVSCAAPARDHADRRCGAKVEEGFGLWTGVPVEGSRQPLVRRRGLPVGPPGRSPAAAPALRGGRPGRRTRGLPRAGHRGRVRGPRADIADGLIKVRGRSQPAQRPWMSVASRAVRSRARRRARVGPILPTGMPSRAPISS